MFDWPEPTQTSPTSTLCTVTVVLPATVISYGPPALSGPKRTAHRPSAPVVVDSLAPATVTVTFSPGSAQPHTRAFAPCWSTMLSPTSAGSLTTALAGVASAQR